MIGGKGTYLWITTRLRRNEGEATLGTLVAEGPVAGTRLAKLAREWGLPKKKTMQPILNSDGERIGTAVVGIDTHLASTFIHRLRSFGVKSADDE